MTSSPDRPTRPPSSTANTLAAAVSVSAMQRIDQVAIASYRIPRLLLMEHAGLALARAAQELAGRVSAKLILVCCGSGYNGGDGMSAARLLVNQGYAVKVIITTPIDSLREEPRIYAQILRQMGVPLLEIEGDGEWARVQEWVEEAEVIVDALLGIGLRGPVRDPSAKLIEMLNASGKPILCADVPSGMDGDTGEPRGVAVCGSMTVSFGKAKTGCFTPEGKRLTGGLVVDPIGFPARLLEESIS